MSLETIKIMVKALSNEQIKAKVIDIIKKYCPECQLILIGSRARGDSNPRSDFDFVIKKTSIRPITKSIIKEEADALPTLKIIEIIDYNDLDEMFKKNVDSEGVVLYANTTSDPA
ncbi:MAG TPA: hypothetical protein DF296_02740 [Candidatus Margulisbacteria bacterium]|nr:MAG: hypothetical protein A2X41_06635 [Candidatus Margulisbacteria bacterium GWE2_39_32]HCT84096.1 hypothetical protein [Candidatus Margulisiibacteriota bacterium]